MTRSQSVNLVLDRLDQAVFHQLGRLKKRCSAIVPWSYVERQIVAAAFTSCNNGMKRCLQIRSLSVY